MSYFHAGRRWRGDGHKAIGLMLSLLAAANLAVGPTAAAAAETAKAEARPTIACDLSGSWKTTRGPMTLTVSGADLSALIVAPNGYETLRGTVTDDGFDIGLVDAEWQAISGSITATPDCGAITGDLGKPFSAKKLAGVDRPAFEDPAELADAVRGLGLAISLLHEVSAHVDLSANDPAVVLSEAGSDPERLRQWVADNTVLLPYQGALRSPLDVLADRKGNSLDRSRLLAHLLTLAGVEVRLSHGVLA